LHKIVDVSILIALGLFLFSCAQLADFCWIWSRMNETRLTNATKAFFMTFWQNLIVAVWSSTCNL
jgi:hypothetical protein